MGKPPLQVVALTKLLMPPLYKSHPVVSSNNDKRPKGVATEHSSEEAMSPTLCPLSKRCLHVPISHMGAERLSEKKVKPGLESGLSPNTHPVSTR